MDSFTLKKIEFDAVRHILSSFCSCSLGRELALKIGPSRNPQAINHWLQQVSHMVRALSEAGRPPFAGVSDISQSLRCAMPAGGAGEEDFARIADALEGAANVKKYLQDLPQELTALHELEAGIGGFDGEIKAIRSVIGPDGKVMDGASQRLATLRRQIAETGKQIHEAIYSYLHRAEVARLLQNVAVTMHGDRYVLPVKLENRGRLEGVVHRESNSGATVFVEPAACVELNNRLVDLSAEERDEVARLLNQLSIRVSGRCQEMADTMRALAQVDLISAKAQYSCKLDMTCPQMAERCPLQLTQARHPLLVDQALRQEQAGTPPHLRHAVVPIDVRLGADFDLLVVTGSNTGGKTVAMKTVALLVVMAQSGMHIPARRDATLPVFRDVFIDVGDEQSLQQSLSTFGGHMKRIRYILAKTDKSSLVLLDELGSGTDPDEGGAIGQAILDELRRIGCLGMVTTHLGVLKAYAYNNERVDNASVDFDEQSLRPTYHLSIGTPGSSHAITVAAKLGLPKRVIAAARRHLSTQGKSLRRAIQSTSIARQSAEQARAEAQAAQLAATGEQEAYQTKLADLHRLQQDFETWLARLPELKEGDEVFVPSLNKPGRLVRLELHRQLAVVDAGHIQAEVPLKELMPDLGQSAVRQQLADLRRQIAEQAAHSQQLQAQAQHAQQEYHKSLQQQRDRARQLDNWIGAIARVKVGDEVAISLRPGHGKLVKLDMPGLRATVQTPQGEIELSIQELFPQTGPFSRHLGDGEQARHAHHARPHGRDGQASPHGQPHAAPPPNRPLPRRAPQSKAAQQNRQAVLAIEPGQQVFVVPFNKRATLIRIKSEKDVAIVQSGAFELEIALADLEPLRAK